MSKKLNKFELEEWKKYKIPTLPNHNRCKINVINLFINNTKAHEMKKCELAYDLMKSGEKIITEAEEISTGLRRDLVSISNSEIYEIENSKILRGRRHPLGINVYWYDLNRFRNRAEVIKDCL